MTDGLAGGVGGVAASDVRSRATPVSEEFRKDVLRGLLARPKSLPCKWLYDARGSRLFEQICETDEYYVTRTELALLERVCPEVAERVGPFACVIEPGSGAGVKICRLLDALSSPRAFVPIEISESALRDSLRKLEQRYPDLAIVPTIGDFSQELSLPKAALVGGRGRRLVFFPGSTISNFAPEEAVSLLRRFRALLRPSDLLLIGVDLVKDHRVLLRAYDDAAGVTAAFNLNLLVRIRNELAPGFDVRRFSHRAIFNERESRIEMHIVSMVDQVQEICGHRVRFQAGETIHTENSYKFTVAGFLALAERAGFDSERCFTDPQEYFSLHLLRARGARPEHN